jgi:hypothetical protein
MCRELKAEAEGLRRKIARVDTLEREMMKIHEAYSALRYRYFSFALQ